MVNQMICTKCKKPIRVEEGQSSAEGIGGSDPKKLTVGPIHYPECPKDKGPN